MAETAGELIEDILLEIVVHGAETDLEPYEANAVIRYMNRFFAKLEGKSIFLGYTKISNTGQIVTIPDGAVEGVIMNMALKMRPQFVSDGTLPPVELIRNAKDGMRDLRRLGQPRMAMEYPNTLPTGSGNDVPDFGSHSHFYPGFELIQGEVDLINNAVNTVIASASTAVLIAGVWTVEANNATLITGSTAGRVTYTGKNTVNLDVEALLTGNPVSGSKVVTYHLYKNGFSLDVTRSFTISSSAPLKIQFPAIVAMSTNDYIEFYVSNDTDSINVLVSQGVFRVEE